MTLAQRGVGRPRELRPGVFWLGDCFRQMIGPLSVHSNHAVFAVGGDTGTLLVDTGSPEHWPVVERQLDELLSRGLAPVTHLLPSHSEVVHSGNLGRLLLKFPEACVVGDTRDYHLTFPDFVDRFAPSEIGDEIDLGGRAVVVLEASFKDLVTSRWAFDTSSRALFTGDGFSFTHHFHGEHECGKAAEEIDDLPIEEFTAVYGEAAFWWSRFADLDPVIEAIAAVIRERDVSMIGPSHGCPIVDPEATVPKVIDGMRLGQRLDRAEIGSRLVERSRVQ